MQLSAEDLAAFRDNAAAASHSASPVGDDDFDFDNVPLDALGEINLDLVHMGLWNKHEKKYTRYLRKRKDRPATQHSDPRNILVAKEHMGLFFGAKRERVKKIEERYSVDIRQIEDSVNVKRAEQTEDKVSATATEQSIEATAAQEKPREHVLLRVSERPGTAFTTETLDAIKRHFTFHHKTVGMPVGSAEFVSDNMRMIQDIARSTRASIQIVRGTNNNEDNALNHGDGAADHGKVHLAVSGPDACVDAAVHALRTHMSYFAIHNEMAFLDTELEDARDAMLRKMGVSIGGNANVSMRDAGRLGGR